MNSKLKQFIRDFSITALILIGFFIIGLGLHIWFDTESLIPPLFVLAVFLISLFTNGYYWGIAAALAGVLAVNFAFTFPFFAFNFTVHENIISASILLVVTIMTSALTTKIKRQEKARLRAKHILRLQQGDCSIDAGFIWSDLLTDLERISDHCSNIAGCIIETAHHNLNMHESLRIIKSESEDFKNKFAYYSNKYSVEN